jgi:hypothetical protein
MQDNVLSRVMLLRQTLLQSSDAEAVQDMLQQANALMQMELKHDVCIDLGSTSRDNTLLAKVAELEHMARAIGDDELKELEAILDVIDASPQVFASLGRELGRQGGESGSTGVLDRPDILDQMTPLLADGGGGGGDDFLDDDEDDGDGDDDDEPWPSAFVGYRTGVVDNVDLGNCRDGCCTALFVDHPGVRAAVWFPTDHAAGLATAIGEHLNRSRGEDAVLSVLPFGAGAAPPRGIVQATIQFFTDDIHLDPVEHETDRAQGGVVRFLAYDQGLGHGGPPLVDILLDASQAKAVRKGLRRVSRNAPRGGHDQGMHE